MLVSHLKKKSFNEKVWVLLRRIPRGNVTTYKLLAKAAGSPKASRAVGNACNKNPDSPKVPCHRVVASDGDIGGYAHGVRAKIALLKKEGVAVKAGKVQDFNRYLYKF